ncbi:MAG: hypothetical protein A2W72_18115 [Burkholderiales bacterium RIFCSPLOWO2_12_67_14]|nr:MAG: hypothetical protein A3I64_07155 [Burkholderiales bacterium RIFCSPLOWO2_02_FULL_67_64]OGB40016.1 MAG: hypothetical protein A3E51_05440 [Burkholderiales bacterium RIFCSPHIGHO2_12_FULL_67_38]OGB49693.1 MAG: hypothetical protein A2W72_18115 [Burkholderiales bacterium RIFCSPLOWO2_12_67_14]
MNVSEQITQVLDLTDAQLQQQADVARRLLQMATLGTPRIASGDPFAPQLLVLHALATAYLALATATPGVTRAASNVAFDIGHDLRRAADRCAKANPN